MLLTRAYRYLIRVKAGEEAVTESIAKKNSTSISTKEMTYRDKSRAKIQLVLGTVYGQISANSMRNVFMEEFIRDNVGGIDKMPYRATFNKIVRVCSDVLMEEVSCIATECVEGLDGASVSVAEDFWRSRERREDFGAITFSLVRSPHPSRG